MCGGVLDRAAEEDGPGEDERVEEEELDRRARHRVRVAFRYHAVQPGHDLEDQLERDHGSDDREGYFEEGQEPPHRARD